MYEGMKVLFHGMRNKNSEVFASLFIYSIILSIKG